MLVGSAHRIRCSVSRTVLGVRQVIVVVVMVVLLEVLLEGFQPHGLRFEEALEMLARIDQALGGDLAVLADQYRVRHLADLEAHADFG